MSFKHELGQVVTVSISEEEGHIKARAEYTHGPNQYLIHYRAADGRAVDVRITEAPHIAMVLIMRMSITFDFKW